jgi:hypothetical protein
MVCATMTWGNADASMDMLVSLTLPGSGGGSLGPKGAMPPYPRKMVNHTNYTYLTNRTWFLKHPLEVTPKR